MCLYLILISKIQYILHFLKLPNLLPPESRTFCHFSRSTKVKVLFHLPKESKGLMSQPLELNNLTLTEAVQIKNGKVKIKNKEDLERFLKFKKCKPSLTGLKTFLYSSSFSNLQISIKYVFTSKLQRRLCKTSSNFPCKLRQTSKVYLLYFNLKIKLFLLPLFSVDFPTMGSNFSTRPRSRKKESLQTESFKSSWAFRRSPNIGEGSGFYPNLGKCLLSKVYYLTRGVKRKNPMKKLFYFSRFNINPASV